MHPPKGPSRQSPDAHLSSPFQPLTVRAHLSFHPGAHWLREQEGVAGAVATPSAPGSSLCLLWSRRQLPLPQPTSYPSSHVLATYP